MLAKSPMPNRAPDALEGFFEHVAPDSNVFIPADAVRKFLQSAKPDDAQAFIDRTGIADQLQEATPNADIVIPASTYLAKVLPTPAHEALKDDVRTQADGLSVRQAQEQEATAQEQIAKHADVLNAAVKNADKQRPEDRVYDDVFQQLVGGGVAPGPARTYAAFWAAHYRANAEHGAGGGDAFEAYKTGGRGLGSRLLGAIPDAEFAGGRRLAQPQVLEPVAGRERPAIAFEVAPDPHDAKLTAEWNALPEAEKFGISSLIAHQVAPRVMAELGTEGHIEHAVGGYMGQTNPSMLLRVRDPAKAVQAAKLLGHVLSQDSMMVTSDKPLEGSSPVEVVNIHIGTADPKTLYDKLYTLTDKNGDHLVGGHTTRDGQMSILNYSGMDTHDFAALIDKTLGAGKYDIDLGKTNAAFPEKKDYGYDDQGHEGQAPAGQSPAGGNAAALRAEASRRIREAIDTAAARAEGTTRKAVELADKAVTSAEANADNERHMLFGEAEGASVEGLPREGAGPGMPSEPGQAQNAERSTPPVPARELAQPGERGSIELPDNSPAVIRAFGPGSDLSTMLHESGHLWLEELKRLAETGEGDAAIKADWERVQRFIGHEGDGEISTPAHEKFAESFETYLMEGRAPSEGLGAVFYRFKTWLSRIYQSLAQRGAPINDEIRGVFDRMLATDAEIAQVRAQDAEGGGPIFKDAKSAGMTKAEFAAYQESIAASDRMAHDQLLKRTTADLRRERTKEWAQEKAGLVAKLKPEQEGRRDVAALEALKDKSVEPEMIATELGYGSAAEMQAEVKALRDIRGSSRKPLPDILAERAAQAEMLRRHGDVLHDGTIEAEALDATRNREADAQAAMELKALERLAGDLNPLSIQAMKRFAKDTIGAKNAGKLSSDHYLRAERRAGQLAQKELATGSMREALAAKREQVLNRALWREAREAEKELAVIARRFERYATAKTRASTDQNALDLIHHLLERFGLREPVPGEREGRDAVRAWLANQEENLGTVYDPAALTDPGYGKPAKDMTVDDFRELNDRIENTAALGRLQQEITRNGKREKIEALREEAKAVAQRIRDVPFKNSPIAKDNYSHLRSFQLLNRKAEFIADKLDAGDPEGVFNRVLIHGAADANVKWNQLTKDFTAKLDALRQGAPKTFIDGLREVLDDSPFVEPDRTDASGNPIPLKVTRHTLISTMLNMGSADGPTSNFHKLAMGWKTDPQTILAWVNKHATKADWDFVQGLWDAVDGLYPEFAAAERRLTGLIPPKVEATPFVTPFGHYRGGYWPVKYDPLRSATGEKSSEAEAIESFQKKFIRASTEAGAAQTRTQVVAPIELDFDKVLYSHIDEITKRIAYGDYVSSAMRFLNDSTIKRIIRDKLGADGDNYFKDWLKRQVNYNPYSDRALSSVANVLRMARTNSVIAGATLNFTVLMEHASAVTQTIARLGMKDTANGFLEYYKSGAWWGDTPNMVYEKSPEMRIRIEAVNRDLRDLGESIKRAESLGGDHPVKRGYAEFQHAAHHVLSWVNQYTIAMPTWIGAYNKALREGMSEEAASRYGDKMVRETHSTGFTKDLSGIQDPKAGPAGEFIKLATVFMGYQNSMWNLKSDMVLAARDGQLGKAAYQALWLSLATPIVSALVKGHWPQENGELSKDPKEWLAWMAESVVTDMFAGLPLVRDVGEAAIDFAVKGKTDTFKLSPIEQNMQNLFAALGDVERLGLHAVGKQRDKAVSAAAPRHIIQTIGWLAAFPGASQVAKVVQFQVDKARHTVPQKHGVAAVTQELSGDLYGPEPGQTR